MKKYFSSYLLPSNKFTNPSKLLPSNSFISIGLNTPIKNMNRKRNVSHSSVGSFETSFNMPIYNSKKYDSSLNNSRTLYNKLMSSYDEDNFHPKEANPPPSINLFVKERYSKIKNRGTKKTKLDKMRKFLSS